MNTEKNKRLIYLLATFSAFGFFLSGCDVDKTADGDMPEIDVDYEEGELPEYDVEMADVDVGTTTETVEVPKVRVVVEEEEVEVPYVDFDMPDDDMDERKMRQTITAKVNAPGSGYDLNITGAYYSDDEIVVLSEIVRTSSSVQSQRGVPLKDSIVINAPEADIVHYVVAPSNEFNGDDGDYQFEMNRRDFDVALGNYMQVYSR
mgnify:CR=1 FL=1